MNQVRPPESLDEAVRRLESAGPAGWRAAVPVLEALVRSGHEAWLVGGTVRDLLLGRSPGLPDVATDAPPERTMALLPGAVPTGIKHGTVTVASESGPVEVTTYRVDAEYSDARHPDRVVFVRSIEEDLARRDFTVNAMAYDPGARRLLDPHDGLTDLRRRLIRAVGDPATRFSEDGLRPFRAVRLSVTLGFSLEDATRRAIPGALTQAGRVAPERVRDELDKMLAGERPSTGFELMRETGLLSLVLPEILEGCGVTQNRHHAHDVYHHTLAVVDEAPASNLPVRLAALLHDVAKPRTRVVVDGEGTFYNHQHVGAEMAERILARLRYPGRIIQSVTRLVEHHMFHYQAGWTDAAVRRFIRRVGADLIDDLFTLREADSRGRGRPEAPGTELAELRRRVEVEQERAMALTVRDLALGGDQVMNALGIPPGPLVGRILEFLLERVTDDPSLNTPEALAGLLRRHISQKG